MTLTLSSVYFFTAIHKMNSAFLSGDVVIRTFELVNQSKRRYFDFWKIEKLLKSQDFRHWIAILMYATIALELALPFLLYSNNYKILGCTLGFFMHLGFTIMFPATLLHFSLLSLASYILFFYF